MAKKHIGTFLTLAAIAGAAAAGISYFLQYKSFHKELDEEFHDFEDDFEEFDDTEDTNAARNYVSLNPEHKTSEETAETGKDAAEEEKPAAQEDASGLKKEEAPADETAKAQDPAPAATVTVEEITE